jgi:tetratricopeptide (TPR) repeat protein
MGEPFDAQVRRLVEEVLDSGRTPEEVCGSNPEYLEEVRARLRRVRNLAGDLERVFPSSGGGRSRAAGRESGALPHIPGYDVEAMIGHGGMGVVYRARHIKLDRVVAVKMLRSGDIASPRELAGLLKEARAIAGLKHPHIVQVHDVGELDGGGEESSLPYFTMEYVEGGSLARKLDGKPLPARDAAALVAALVEAVHTAHMGGIVHRDIKPANVLLGLDGSPKITDFGLARRTQGEPTGTLSAAAMGTPSYMAPEQALGRPEAFQPSVDVYALGALLYELLTGRPPFRAESNVETHRQVISQEPVAPSRLNAKVPRDLETICLKCLQKTISRRYATARDLSDDLGRFQRGEPIRARPIGPLERLSKLARRHPAYTAAVIGAMVAVGAILGAVLWTLSQRAAVERAVSDDLAEVVRLEEASEWRAARNMLERAKTRLAAAGGGDRLTMRASEIGRELDLVDRLSAMRFELGTSARDLLVDKAQSWGKYRQAFADAGLLVEGDAPEDFAGRVARSPARTALITGMDDMAISAAHPADLDWILRGTRLADPDPQWRDKARDERVWSSHAALIALAREAPVESQPPTLLLTVAGRLLETGPAEAERLIRRVQAAHPSDFWANFALAEALDARQSADAIGYYRAAIALRPDAAAAHVLLALALAAQDRIDEAIDSMSRAVSLDPGSWVAQYNLARWLLRQQQTEEGLKHARIAIEIDHPQQGMAHLVLGRGLMQAGRPCEGAESIQRALTLTPGDEHMRALLARALSECEAASKGPASHGP